MISQIESDKANPSYKVLEAIAEKLETSLEYFLTDVQSHLEQGTAYKVARAQMASNSFGRAAELLTTLLEQKASNLNVFDIKIDLAICYVELSRHEEAISALEEVVDQSLTKQQHHTALRALNALANVEKRRRKYHHAIYFWRKGCELFDQ
jgi:HTH-type transcriptional regulator, quorum sensing regulator NprR